MPRTAALLLALAGLAAAAEPFRVTPVDGGLYRGPAPRERGHFEQLRRLGVRTILDLRSWPPEASRREAALAAEYGFTYINFRWPATPWKCGDAEVAYRYLLRLECRPLYFHCRVGRERTGMVVALYRLRRQGWSPEAAYEELTRTGPRNVFWYYHDYFWRTAYGPGCRPPRLPR